jgi:hypothetical protein
MKKILASVATVVAVAGFATQAFADTITQSTTLAATCTISVLNGSLPAGTGFDNSIQSDNNGEIKTKCSSAGSKLDVKLDAHVAGIDDPNLQAITREFNLVNGAGAYSAGGSAGFVTPGFAAAPLQYTNLTNGYVNVFSTLKVKTKVIAPATQFLAASTIPYTVRVIASVTP